MVRPTTHRIDNFFRIVPDPDSASVTISVAVARFEFEESESVAEAIGRYWALGIFGVRESGPRGLVTMNCRVSSRTPEINPIEFDFAGVSRADRPMGEAFQDAIDVAAKVFTTYLLGARFNPYEI